MGHRFAICGDPGMGKTTLARRIFRAHQGPAIFFDMIGAAHRDLKGLKVPVRPSETGWKYDRILQALRSGRKVILNFEDCRQPYRSKFADGLAAELNNTHLRDVMLVVDEPKNVLSRKRRFYSYNMEYLLSEGRNKGIEKAGLIPQILTSIDYEVMGLCSTFIILKTIYVPNLKRLEELLGLSRDQWLYVRSVIVTLERGEFVLYKDGKITIYRRRSSNEITRVETAESAGDAAARTDRPGDPKDAGPGPAQGQGPG